MPLCLNEQEQSETRCLTNFLLNRYFTCMISILLYQLLRKRNLFIYYVKKFASTHKQRTQSAVLSDAINFLKCNCRVDVPRACRAVPVCVLKE